jgi:hypothetical protein
MKLPFTTAQFLEVFKEYNTTVFPVQILLLLLAAFVIYLTMKTVRSSGKTITFVLSFFWAWMGVAYHLAFFAAINKAAYIFGALFIVESILLLVYSFAGSPSFSFRKQISGVTSAGLLTYALIVYPIVGYIGGHGYPYSPTFGLPCPTTIFTFAIFLLAQNRLPFYILVIPFLWTVIGFSAAFRLGIYEDVGLIVTGLLFLILNSIKRKSNHNTHVEWNKLHIEHH